eukprot:2333609-Prorocentrum_lima.AAC.1
MFLPAAVLVAVGDDDVLHEGVPVGLKVLILHVGPGFGVLLRFGVVVRLRFLVMSVLVVVGVGGS